MKRTGFLLAAVVGALAACSEGQKNHNASSSDSFHIAGVVRGVDSGWMILSHRDTAGNTITDSTPVRAGAFAFSGVQDEPALYSLGRGGTHQPVLKFFVENDSIHINTSGDSVSAGTVTGPPSNRVYRTFLSRTGPTEALMDTLNDRYAAAYKRGDKGGLQGMEATYDSLAGARNGAIADFVRTHKKSVISAWAVASNLLYYPDAGRLGKLYDELDTSARRTSYGRKIREALVTARRVAIGKPAPDFTENDPQGKPLSLSSLRGKYVLVDFWASWCEPCRAENPGVVKAFKKYENDGFTVLSVSLDTDRGDWLKAIRQDHLSWDQVSDLNGWRNAVAEEYGVRAIPANFLVNPKGIIVAENLQGDQLENKLAELLSHS